MVTRADAEELLLTVFADPVAARRRAQEELVPDPDPFVASIGHQVTGIVVRDLGQTDAALAHLRTALRIARRSGDLARESDVRATLGATLAVSGMVRAGLAQLDRATSSLSGAHRARVLYRRAWVLERLLADYEGSIADLRTAQAEFARVGDREWQLRAHQLEGLVLARSGDLASAAHAFETTRVIATELQIPWAVAIAVHNAGWVAFLGGDLPLALERYADASGLFDELHITSVDLVFDRAEAYLAAGLAVDALAVVEQALVARPLQAREHADLLVSIAEAALAVGDWERAAAAADEGSRLLRRQSRDVHRLRADLRSITARAEAGDPPARLLPRVERLVRASREAQVAELPQALLLGARVAGQVNSPRAAVLAETWLHEAAEFRRSGSSLVRALGWLALARVRAGAGDTGSVLRACDVGLKALDEHRAVLGSSELRAVVSGHGASLAELGTRTALASRDARRLLRWSERWRAVALTVPAATTGHDEETTADLAALRAQHRQLAEARAAGGATERLERSVVRLEQSVRQRLLQVRGTGVAVPAFSVDDLVDALAEDGTTLVELVEVDGRLHAVVVGRRRVRRFAVGPATAARQAVDFARYTLRQAARGGRARLELAGTRLQQALLGPAAAALRTDGPVLVCAPGTLQDVPWGLLPLLTGRPVTTTPSARLWLRSRSGDEPRGGGRVLLVGPGLGTGGAEVPAVAAEDPGARVLTGADATVEAALAALEGAELAHVAAHGRFRDDSPLFSSLQLADGPLVVHDLQRLRRTPHRVVLSACESGVMQPVGGHELLGLAAALLSMGTAGVVSSLAEVDDAATVEVMVALHRALREGVGLGEALLAARRHGAGDPVLTATAASFTVLGS